MKRTLSLPVLRSLGGVGLLLFPFGLSAGQTMSTLLNQPSKVAIEVTTKFKRQYDFQDAPWNALHTTYFKLEKKFLSLQEKVENFRISGETSSRYTTEIALLNVTGNNIHLQCTTTREDDSPQQQIWPLTIPCNQDFTRTKELDLLDDAGEKVKVTVTSTITQ